MKLKKIFVGGLLSIGLLTIGAEAGFGRGFFSAGNPGGLQTGPSYRLAPMPANQAWERNNAWAGYQAQKIQTQASNISTEKSGSATANAVSP